MGMRMQDVYFWNLGIKKKFEGRGKKDNEMYPLDFEAFYLFSLLLRSAVPSFFRLGVNIPKPKATRSQVVMWFLLSVLHTKPIARHYETPSKVHS